MTMMKTVKREKGQGMVEYGLIVGLISILVIAVFIGLGPRMLGIFDNWASAENLDEAQYMTSEAVYD